MKRCSNCGTQLSDDSLFCPNCGTKCVPDTAENDSANRPVNNNPRNGHSSNKISLVGLILGSVGILLSIICIVTCYKVSCSIVFVYVEDISADTVLRLLGIFVSIAGIVVSAIGSGRSKSAFGTSDKKAVAGLILSIVALILLFIGGIISCSHSCAACSSTFG